ncbi:hypothetical protein DT73_10920 [Mangrovibacter sp. MFB070]|nr:hypothetical protein DT73_10920 [Mangrovibacter sp. MFB070]
MGSNNKNANGRHIGSRKNIFRKKFIAYLISRIKHNLKQKNVYYHPLLKIFTKAQMNILFTL